MLPRGAAILCSHTNTSTYTYQEASVLLPSLPPFLPLSLFGHRRATVSTASHSLERLVYADLFPLPMTPLTPPSDPSPIPSCLPLSPPACPSPYRRATATTATPQTTRCRSPRWRCWWRPTSTILTGAPLSCCGGVWHAIFPASAASAAGELFAVTRAEGEVPADPLAFTL